MSDRIRPLTKGELDGLSFQPKYLIQLSPLVNRAIAYAIQQSQPVSEAEVEAVARALVLCRPGTYGDGTPITPDHILPWNGQPEWTNHVDMARAALRASGRVIEEAPQ